MEKGLAIPILLIAEVDIGSPLLTLHVSIDADGSSHSLRPTAPDLCLALVFPRRYAKMFVKVGCGLTRSKCIMDPRILGSPLRGSRHSSLRL